MSVNEADIGSIHMGQPVSFTVDTYPGLVFRGEVGKIRLNATMTQNVVTYTIEVITDNSDGRLLPYLTANVQFELSRSTGVLLAPNAALRWFPQPAQVDAKFKDIVEGASRTGGNSAGAGPPPAAPVDAPQRQRSVWVPAGNRGRPVNVSIGPTDSAMTEVHGEEVKEGLEVIVGEQRQAPGDSTRSPFTP
ncbi:MAG: HlyD family efflux transporter periplasmic adaptor subunit, partial [Proteobacteria bacterium]|nr:HlyD family efflux transporter periplasmic adaptor subunit [Pseudomonadota bacterium]